MSDIKILKDGFIDYEACMKEIDDKFIELNSLESSLRKKLGEKGWQGKSRDKCEIILTLISAYKKKVKEILDEMNHKEQELKQNVSNFSLNSSVVKSL